MTSQTNVWRRVVKKRPELVELIAELEEVRRVTEALPADVHARTPNYMDSFHCPLTMELMRDPVITADGQTYERAEIEVGLHLERGRVS